MAERCGGVIGGSVPPPGFGGGGLGDEPEPAEIFRPYAGGRYYCETMCLQTGTNEKISSNSGTVAALTNIGPLFCGGSISWTSIGAVMRFASSPGTPPNTYFVIYGLDTDTLFPTTLLYQGSAHAQGTTLAFVSDSIAITTSHKWIGIGWHCDGGGLGVLTENAAFRAGGPLAAAGLGQAYAPYGFSQSGTTLTPIITLSANQASGTASAALPSAFSVTPDATVVNPTLSTGTYIRRA